MRMCLMQEARRESVSVSYVLKNARCDNWLIRDSKASVPYVLLGGGTSQTSICLTPSHVSISTGRRPVINDSSIGAPPWVHFPDPPVTNPAR